MDPYKVLELPRSATDVDIKKQYKRFALKHHPDKGGDAEKFKEITQAYAVLSNPDKKKMYDRFGVTDDSEASDMGGNFGTHFNANMFNTMFQETFASKNNRVVEWEVSLETLFMGKKTRVKIERKVMNGDIEKCGHCKGSGRQTREIKMGFMTQRITNMCSQCQGSGSHVQTTTCQEVFDFEIQPGTKSGTQIVFKSKGHVFPNGSYSDLVIVLKEKKHPNFIRVKQNLIHKVTIGLVEAFCGFEYAFQYLDGTKIVVRYNDIIRVTNKNDTPFCLCLPEYGMPDFRHDKRGNLILVFDILFPKTIPDELKKSLEDHVEAIIPRISQNPQKQTNESSIIHELVPYTLRHRDVDDVEPGENSNTNTCTPS